MQRLNALLVTEFQFQEVPQPEVVVMVVELHHHLWLSEVCLGAVDSDLYLNS